MGWRGLIFDVCTRSRSWRCNTARTGHFDNWCPNEVADDTKLFSKSALLEPQTWTAALRHPNYKCTWHHRALHNCYAPLMMVPSPERRGVEHGWVTLRERTKCFSSACGGLWRLGSGSYNFFYTVYGVLRQLHGPTRFALRKIMKPIFEFQLNRILENWFNLISSETRGPNEFECKSNCSM